MSVRPLVDFEGQQGDGLAEHLGEVGERVDALPVGDFFARVKPLLDRMEVSLRSLKQVHAGSPA
jgi:hypothetical protein